jgi:CheY-like chemotaxis protein
MRGRLALDMAREHQPDLILLDLHLPDLNGDQVLVQLQADPRTRAIPVVMLSADVTPQQKVHLLKAGAWNYLTKPINVDYLLNMLNDLFGMNAPPTVNKGSPV